MDSFVTTAIVGTGQQSINEIVTGSAVDELAAQLPANEKERALLLTAGAWSIYRQTGYVIQPAPDAPTQAGPETLPACSSEVAHLLAPQFNIEYKKLLHEGLQRLKQAGKRLPYDHLPAALSFGASSRETRPLLAAVIGERGRWLAQFNAGWSWATQFLTDGAETLPTDAETIWQEGTSGQRCEILRRLRAIDPARARDWLAAPWKKEKAEVRADFLATFEVGLSADDEPFLETALDDRSANVRAGAASLLARLPDSAFARRMLERADAWLDYRDGQFASPLPTFTDEQARKTATLVEQWTRDGITVASSNRGPQAALLNAFQQVLAYIPPDHWETRFAATAERLLACAQNSELNETLLKGWTSATILHNNVRWMAALAGCLQDRQTIWNVIAHLPQAEAEQAVEKQVDDQTFWCASLAYLPKPWSAEFSEHALHILKDYTKTTTNHLHYQHWETALFAAAYGIPVPCFDAALEPWQMPEETAKDWYTQRWKNNLTEFHRIVRLRKRIIDEIV